MRLRPPARGRGRRPVRGSSHGRHPWSLLESAAVRSASLSAFRACRRPAPLRRGLSADAVGIGVPVPYSAFRRFLPRCIGSSCLCCRPDAQRIGSTCLRRLPSARRRGGQRQLRGDAYRHGRGIRPIGARIDGQLFNTLPSIRVWIFAI